MPNHFALFYYFSFFFFFFRFPMYQHVNLLFYKITKGKLNALNYRVKIDAFPNFPMFPHIFINPTIFTIFADNYTYYELKIKDGIPNPPYTSLSLPKFSNIQKSARRGGGGNGGSWFLHIDAYYVECVHVVGKRCATYARSHECHSEGHPLPRTQTALPGAGVCAAFIETFL